MVRATTARAAATANVIRMPVATASEGAVAMSLDADPNAKTAPITDAPVMSPRLRDKLSMPEMASNRGIHYARSMLHGGAVALKVGES